MSKSALITGITGQDGSYLAELLLEKGYRVHGLVRRNSLPNTGRIDHLVGNPNLSLLDGDMLDQASLIRAMRESAPDEIYNLAAHSFVGGSWSQPVLVAEVTGMGVTRLLEAVRIVRPKARFYQASTSELYGNAKTRMMDEETPFAPQSPYGVAKLYAHRIVLNYRESFGMFACCGILFNHESPRRGLEFVTRKVTRAAARIKLGLEKKLYLGNLDAARDWGFAGDYVEAMWLMLQQEKPEEFVIATGKSHTIRDLCRVAFEYVDLSWKDYVTIDEKFVRPAEIHRLCGDAGRARKQLNWNPSVDFDQLIMDMVQSDLQTERRMMK